MQLIYIFIKTIYFYRYYIYFTKKHQENISTSRYNRLKTMRRHISKHQNNAKRKAKKALNNRLICKFI